MSITLLVFDSHPVQYRVPIWQSLASIIPGDVHIVYASDCSVKGHQDVGFGKTFSWDDPLLENYDYSILNCEKGKPLSGWQSLTGQGVSAIIDKMKPKAILLTGLNYKYDLVAYLEARRRGIPLWLRCETQDEAVRRSKIKSIGRSLLYYSVYTGFNKIFYIGELNRLHYLKHGVSGFKLRPARYGTIDRFINMNDKIKIDIRKSTRADKGIQPADFVVGFSGKFITKKNPTILFSMLESLPETVRLRTVLYFIGSGELEDLLYSASQKAFQQFGVKSFFTGFVNQSGLSSHYLALDVLVLPSRRMGETWGLVANEAMQAGCGVVVSDAVGCGADFKNWDRFRIFKEGNANDLANCLVDLSSLERDFNWAEENLKSYSIENSAKSIATEVQSINKLVAY